MQISSNSVYINLRKKCLTNCFELGYYKMKIIDIVYVKELKVIHRP